MDPRSPEMFMFEVDPIQGPISSDEWRYSSELGYWQAFAPITTKSALTAV